MTIPATTATTDFASVEHNLGSQVSKTEVNNTQNPETTSKVRKVVGAILLVLGALVLAAGVAALTLPPVGVAVGLAGAALLYVGVSFIGGGFILSNVGSFLLGRNVQTKKVEEEDEEFEAVKVSEGQSKVVAFEEIDSEGINAEDTSL